MLIFGVNDRSTDSVMNWLDTKGGESIRIDSTRDFSLIHLGLKSNGSPQLVFSVRGKEYDLDEIHSIWYRRGSELRLSQNDKINYGSHSNDTFHDLVSNYLKGESRVLIETVNYLFLRKHHLSNPLYASPNKLITLLRAKDAGLEIPDTFICSQKQHLQNFHGVHEGIITKPMSEVATFPTVTGKEVFHLSKIGSNVQPDQLSYFGSYTEEVQENEIKTLSTTFFPSLFQEKLNKAVELRVFYLDESCYAMAIFSQLDQQTETDFRRYNREKPNRNVPFILPTEIESNIVRFMKSMRLKTGSIDIVVTTDNRYVFLEVNPVGQYGMTSYPCQYNLDEKIADYLLKED